MFPHKYPSTKHWPWSQEIHRDDSTHEDPMNFVGVEVVITEKLDGGNTCLWNGDVFARSTGQPATQGWFAMVKKHHAYKTIGEPLDLFTYGEDLYGIHSIAYDALQEDQTYRVFNMRKGDTWLSWDDVKAQSSAMDLLTVPEIFRGKFESVEQITKFFESQINLPSALGPTKEGFVMRWADSFHNNDFPYKTAKYVRRGHVQTDQHWTRNWKPAPLKK